MRFHALLIVAVIVAVHGRADDRLTGTEPLAMHGDVSAQMVEGIDRFLNRELERSPGTRASLWQRDFSSPAKYARSVQSARNRFRAMIGAVDQRVRVTELHYEGTTDQLSRILDARRYEIFAVRWPVFADVWADGLWLKQKSKPMAGVVVVPDADQTPEMLAGVAAGIDAESQLARRLAEGGCDVLVPTLISRSDTFSGNAKINRFTNQPHREWIYRQAYEMGRHVIGYEVEKVLAGVDWFAQQKAGSATKTIAVAGYGEGALIAFYAAALDERIDATLVSGYFDAREGIWSEPIYRNLFGLLKEFGDAEIATLISPRRLVIEHSAAPIVHGPPLVKDGRVGGAAPGKLTTPDQESVTREFERAKALLKEGGDSFLTNLVLVSGEEPLKFGSEAALSALLPELPPGDVAQSKTAQPQRFVDLKPEAMMERQRRQVHQLVEHTQRLFRHSRLVRDEFFWASTKSVSSASWPPTRARFQKMFFEKSLGKIDAPVAPQNPRTRRLFETEKFTAYETVLDVYADVFAWGILLLPKDINDGERRPVVVCQHGLEGVPMDVVTTNTTEEAFGYYKGFASRLAERGFVVFVPHNPYRGGDRFRVLQRKANPLGLSLFSFIVAQHEQLLTWLTTQPFVDPERIAFYGLSYGGKTAIRVPAVLNRYALSICSGDFNEWIYKNVSLDFPASYMFTGEYEMPEWNLGNTFNYAEMAALIAPRPFMVERGHDDAVGEDEWVAYEYAKVKRFYDKLHIGDRTEIEYFNGPHTIHGEGTFKFLHKHLNWDESKANK